MLSHIKYTHLKSVGVDVGSIHSSLTHFLHPLILDFRACFSLHLKDNGRIIYHISRVDLCVHVERVWVRKGWLLTPTLVFWILWLYKCIKQFVKRDRLILYRCAQNGLANLTKCRDCCSRLIIDEVWQLSMSWTTIHRKRREQNRTNLILVNICVSQSFFTIVHLSYIIRILLPDSGGGEQWKII